MTLAGVADDDLLEAAQGLLRCLERTVECALRRVQGVAGGPGSKWIDQHESDLGVRGHCKAVRRRIAEGKGGAKMGAGRRYLLTREALWEEMSHSPKPGLRKAGARNVGPAGEPPSRGDIIAEETAQKLRALRHRK